MLVLSRKSIFSHDFVSLYLCHLSPGWSIGVGRSAAIASSHVVWGVAPPAREGRFALLLITFTSAVSCLPLVSLSITWVVVLIVAWGAPPAWVASVPVPVGRIFAALNGHSAWPSNIGCLGTLQNWRSHTVNVSFGNIVGCMIKKVSRSQLCSVKWLGAS